MPYIRNHYRVTERSLGIGHSLGASFMMQSLINCAPFTDYFFLSPNMTFGKDRKLLAAQFCNYKFDTNKIAISSLAMLVRKGLVEIGNIGKQQEI